MPAGAELTKKAIAPGSTEYGQRQKLESNLSAAMAQPGSPGAGTGAAPPLPATGNPLQALLSGQVSGEAQPLTAGLSVGPGPGPAAQPDPMLGDRASRLRMIASQAASPQLRALARSALRSMAREPI